MHASAQEFTYLWKLNRAHWLRVWRHICMWPQLWTGTSALARARARGAGSEQLGVFAVREALVGPSVSHNGPMRCLCLHCTQSSNSVCFRPLCHSGALLLRTHTKLSRLGPGSHLQNRGQVHWEIRENFRNAPDTCVVFSLLLIMFQHSTRVTQIFNVCNFTRFFFGGGGLDRSQRQSCCRVVGTPLSHNHTSSHCHIQEWEKAVLFFKEEPLLPS